MDHIWRRHNAMEVTLALWYTEGDAGQSAQHQLSRRLRWSCSRNYDDKGKGCWCWWTMSGTIAGCQSEVTWFYCFALANTHSNSFLKNLRAKLDLQFCWAPLGPYPFGSRFSPYFFSNVLIFFKFFPEVISNPFILQENLLCRFYFLAYICIGLSTCVLYLLLWR